MPRKKSLNSQPEEPTDKLNTPVETSQPSLCDRCSSARALVKMQSDSTGNVLALCMHCYNIVSFSLLLAGFKMIMDLRDTLI